VFVMLAGWVGQFVNAHVFHIGVRLIATIYRGDDDETRPQELLDPRWSWCVFIAFQIAVAAIAAGLVLDNPPIAIGGAAAGLFGWLAMITTLGRARIAAMNLRAV
ncbi:MAG TPA: hypothetical protein VEW74_06545, partial [Candidatus Nitrosotalea sp.]|nr:hypothetical protein [Candidatus Nitrosotalea sp.]